jgi:hypothetical protein
MESILIEIDSITRDALIRYAENKGMTIDAAADYLLTRDMQIFMEGVNHGATKIDSAYKGLTKALDEALNSGDGTYKP